MKSQNLAWFGLGLALGTVTGFLITTAGVAVGFHQNPEKFREILDDIQAKLKEAAETVTETVADEPEEAPRHSHRLHNRPVRRV